MVTTNYQDYLNHRRMRQWRRKWHRRFGVWPRKDDAVPINDKAVSLIHRNGQASRYPRQQSQYGAKRYKPSTAAE